MGKLNLIHRAASGAGAAHAFITAAAFSYFLVLCVVDEHRRRKAAKASGSVVDLRPAYTATTLGKRGSPPSPKANRR